MQNERFFIHDLMPFAEVRYSTGSNRHFKSHMHKTLSIGSIDEGEVLYSVAGQQAVLVPGALATINPETLHSCNPVNHAPRSYYMLYLDPHWCLRVQQSIWDVETLVEMNKIKIDDHSLYETFCHTMEELMDQSRLLQEKEQMLLDLMVKVFRIACRPQATIREPKGNIDKLKQLLSEDLQKDLPLHSLASELAINPYTLIRTFKAVTGITPHAYRMNCRIEQAKIYLKQGWDITDTALECGFFDQSHFHRHFKDMTTVTPFEYRVNFIQ